LDLTSENLFQNLSSNHRRSIKTAIKAGLQIREETSSAACSLHASLIGLSMTRRKDRGESVSDAIDATEFHAFVDAGAGTMFQVVSDEKVLSSLLVLTGSSGAYYQSAGTSPEGMSLGASPFLITKVAELLRERNFKVFNLGGATEDTPGLFRFKRGFGTTPVYLEATTLYIGSKIKKKLVTAAHLLRSDRGALVNELMGQPERLYVYSATPSSISQPDEIEGAVFEKLTDESLVQLEQNATFREHTTRFNNLGFNGAYGVYIGGQLAHISWFIKAEQDSPNSLVGLKAGEAEITHCLTHPDFKGRGIYPYVIRQLCALAAEVGVQRVFMITNVKNQASQRGIEKAGLTRRGRIVRIRLPSGNEDRFFVYRAHRIFPQKL
jgi:RimJ/RimL family protein N-acetyltransferase